VTFLKCHRNLDQPLTVLMLIMRTGDADGAATPMAARSTCPRGRKSTFPRNRKIKSSRHPERDKPCALDDFGDELLDDWMVAYPAADQARSD
jgi:hypothetical protein